MKKFIRLLNLKNYDSTLLQQKLLEKLKEQFMLRTQLKLGQLNKSHMLKTVRRNVAFIKTYLFKK